MPIIFRVTCSSCKYHLDFPDALMIVLDDEGIDHNCIHPFEKSIISKEETEFYCIWNVIKREYIKSQRIE